MINKLAHVLCGLIAGLSSYFIPQGGVLTLAITYAFIKYECNEQRALLREEGRFDSAYAEIREFIWGLVLAFFVILVLTALRWQWL